MVGWYYSITAAWGPRPETPAEVGEEWLKGFDAISRIGPGFAGWRMYGAAGPRLLPMDQFRQQMTQIVETRVMKDDWRKPAPDEGYNICATTAAQESDEPTMSSSEFWTESKLGSQWKNFMWLTMGGIGRAGDLSAIRYPEMKALVWAVASNWNTPWANAGIQSSTITPLDEPFEYSFPDAPRYQDRQCYGRPWIGYLSAERTAGLVTPSALHSERTPDGGMLISATTDQFDPENPDQLALSRLLSDIMLERGGDPRI